MIKLIKNALLYAPDEMGKKDILICGEKIADIQDKIDITGLRIEIIDVEGKIVTPGLIDQHTHITGAGGKHGFASMTPEIMLGEFISCGTTSCMGVLGTDGSTRSIKGLYAKAKSLEQEGISTYILTSYFGMPPLTFTGNIQDDMIFIDKVVGCKLAISDERSSFPSERDILQYLKQVRVGGLIAGKKGILHLHLGNLDTGLQILIDIVKKHQFPIQHISPTHVGRTKLLFEQAIEFAKLGGMIDISTGGTKYDEPHKQVLYALEKGVSIDKITLSSDGNAGLGKLDPKGNLVGFKKAPIHLNIVEVIRLLKTKEVSITNAFKLITVNPAKNLAINRHKGSIESGYDADFCFFDDNWHLTDVISRGKIMMKEKRLVNTGFFESTDSGYPNIHGEV